MSPPPDVDRRQESGQAEQLDVFAQPAPAPAGPETARGRRLAEDGHRRARQGTPPAVVAALGRTIRELADEGIDFTAETVRERCAPLGNPNALAAAIAAAARDDVIVCVGAAVATRPEARGRLLRVWRRTGAS